MPLFNRIIRTVSLVGIGIFDIMAIALFIIFAISGNINLFVIIWMILAGISSYFFILLMGIMMPSKIILGDNTFKIKILFAVKELKYSQINKIICYQFYYSKLLWVKTDGKTLFNKYIIISLTKQIMEQFLEEIKTKTDKLQTKEFIVTY